jgi:hypothetical protein
MVRKQSVYCILSVEIVIRNSFTRLGWGKLFILIFFPYSISLSVQVKDANLLLSNLSTREVDNILIE